MRAVGGSYFIKMLIQIFLESLIINGKKTTIVTTIAINVFNKPMPIIKKAITKAATANAIPTA